MPVNEFVIETKTTIADQRVKDLLCSAIEGGSNYWYVIVGYVYPPGRAREDYKPEDDPRYMIVPLEVGGAVRFRTLDNDKIDGTNQWQLDRDTIKRGFQIMHDKYPRHFTNFVAENDDAETGDVFLQCCLFGELVFG
jgi:hypothetical protein